MTVKMVDTSNEEHLPVFASLNWTIIELVIARVSMRMIKSVGDICSVSVMEQTLRELISLYGKAVKSIFALYELIESLLLKHRLLV